MGSARPPGLRRTVRHFPRKARRAGILSIRGKARVELWTSPCLDFPGAKNRVRFHFYNPFRIMQVFTNPGETLGTAVKPDWDFLEPHTSGWFR